MLKHVSPIERESIVLYGLCVPYRRLAQIRDAKDPAP